MPQIPQMRMGQILLRPEMERSQMRSLAPQVASCKTRVIKRPHKIKMIDKLGVIPNKSTKI